MYKIPVLFALIVSGLFLSSCNQAEHGAFIDSRDGMEYEWVRIGGQKWLTTNLAYLPEVWPISEQSDSIPMYYVYGNQSRDPEQAVRQKIQAAALDSVINPYTTYGVLYNHAAVRQEENLCPTGWHVPTDADWKQLELSLGMDDQALDILGHRFEGHLGHRLKDSTGWGNNGNGLNELGLAIRPAGEGFSGARFHSEGVSAVFWTNTTDQFGNAMVREFTCCEEGITREWADRRDAYSVRCVQ